MRVYLVALAVLVTAAPAFAALGHDPHGISYLSAEGRPLPLSEGKPLRELLYREGPFPA